MTIEILAPIAATGLVSLVSLVGILTLSLKKTEIHNLIPTLVALAAGTMLGGVFLHLLPEAMQVLSAPQVLKITLGSFIFFLLIEKLLHWRHCHDEDCEVHDFGYLNLIGDAVHNVIDGVVIAAAFLASPTLGWLTASAVIMHEVPQEIGDFGVLLKAGFTRKKALMFNFISALTSFVGLGIGLFFGEASQLFAANLLPVAAGSLLYIGAADLLPQLREESDSKLLWKNFGVFLIGISLSWLLAG